MSRINYHDVAEIFETDLSESDLIAFVEDAHRIVENRCSAHTSDEDALAAVETYLAAHLASSKDPRVQSASHESVDIEYNAGGDRYWHRAVLADPTNRLARPNGFTTLTT
ncbi:MULTISPECIES: hypothetical protein [Haloarcula]|uniref:hypothetical protein n=1 Tax=Haloarcula TaxID=2237 RepID=UPI000F8CBB0F|nr:MULTISPECIES: hypothetical protein [Haloarcula]NHX41389.1 hypothetical protein [Haloarcula sp. R1-2]